MKFVKKAYTCQVLYFCAKGHYSGELYNFKDGLSEEGRRQELQNIKAKQIATHIRPPGLWLINPISAMAINGQNCMLLVT